MSVIIGDGGPTSHGFHQMHYITECAKKYQLAVVRGVTIPTEFTPNHFSIGSIFHAARAAWFGRGFSTGPKTWKAIVKAAQKEAAGQKLPVTFKAEALALSYFREYMEHWKLYPKPRVIAVEYLIGPVKLDKSDPMNIVRTARLDALAEYPLHGLCIDESKTSSDPVSVVTAQYRTHGQTLLQQLLYKLAPQGEAQHGPVAGTMLDVTQKGYGGRPSKFGRVFLPFEPRVLRWFTSSMRGFLKDAARIKYDSKVRRNFGACTGLGKHPCPYHDLCVYGKAAASKYVYGKDARPLTDWTPTKQEPVPPWK